MRMKKLMILAVAAIAAIACSRTYDTAPASEKAIGFGTWTDVMTKRTDAAATTFAADDNFNVFGSKVLSGTPSVVFNGDVVTASGDPITWTYSPARFWDPSATGYTFYAISPAGLLPEGMTNEQKTTAATTGAFTTAEIVFDGTVAKDVLVAKQTPVAPAAYNTTVKLDFQHVGTLLDLKVKKSYTLKDATVEVTALSIENIKYKGTYSVATYTDNKPDVAIANWAATADLQTFDTATSTPATIAAYGYDDASVADPENPVNGTATAFFTNFVIMPQTLVAAGETNPQRIKISYKITTGVGEVTTHTDKIVAFADFDIKDNKVNNDTAVAGWNPGIHYIYTLTLDVNKIDFSASVTNWETTTNGYHNLIN